MEKHLPNYISHTICWHCWHLTKQCNLSDLSHSQSDLWSIQHLSSDFLAVHTRVYASKGKNQGVLHLTGFAKVDITKLNHALCVLLALPIITEQFVLCLTLKSNYALIVHCTIHILVNALVYLHLDHVYLHLVVILPYFRKI